MGSQASDFRPFVFYINKSFGVYRYRQLGDWEKIYYCASFEPRAFDVFRRKSFYAYMLCFRIIHLCKCWAHRILKNLRNLAHWNFTYFSKVLMKKGSMYCHSQEDGFNKDISEKISQLYPILLIAWRDENTNHLRMWGTEQCLESSKILTLHPPSTQRVCPPPAPKAGGATHSPGGEGLGGQYFARRQTLDLPLTE